jgi:hypothetical protein
MLLPDLVRLVQDHADSLAAEFIDSLRRDPGVTFLHAVGDDELRQRLLEIYRSCARWNIAAESGGYHQRREVDLSYTELGRLRRAQGVPASQLVRALHQAKSHLLDFIRRNAAADSSIELYQETELETMVHDFFDSAVEHALQGYESAAVVIPPRPAFAPR